MANTGNTQQQIDYGAAANDGTGDPLRTAFIKTDDNFDNIWLAGPVGSNITVTNNTIQANNTNGNLILSPNGVGVVQTNSKLLPRLNNTYDLGSSALKYRAGYFGTGGLVIDGNVTITGNLTAGNISYTSNVFVGDLQGSVFADDSTIMVDAIDNVLYAGRAAISGNVSATYFIGNGSQLTGLAATYGNANVVANLAALGSNPVSTTGNISGNFFIGNGSQLTGMAATYGNANVVANLAALGSNPVSTTGNITGGYINGNGSQLSGIVSSYGNANVVANVAALGSNPVSTTGNVTAGYFIGNGTALASITGANVTGTVASATTATTAGTVTTAAQGNITSVGTLTSLAVTGNVSGGNVSAVGNIAASYFIGNGSQLTGITAGGSGTVTSVQGAGVVSGLSLTGNVTTAGNLTLGGTLSLASVTGDISTTGNITGGYIFGNGSQLTDIVSSYGNANVVANLAALGSNPVSTTGNITAGYFIGNGSALASITGANVTGTVGNATTATTAGTVTTAAQANITSVGVLTSLSSTGNVTAANFFGNGNTLSNVATTFESTWTVPTGNSTQSFTVTPNNTYYLWVDCNIPNGILTWNATGTVTNTNVPVVGAQYAWVYSGGGTPIDFTSIPDQFVGTSNTIVRSSVSPSATTNRFDFGINNTSGNTVTVNYGYARIS